jgi:hypothetical protein
MRAGKRFRAGLRKAITGWGIVGSMGCRSWQVVSPSPEEYLRSHTPEQVRVTRVDSSRIVLQAPKIQADSIVGTVGGGLKADDPVRITGVPLAGVGTVEVRHTDAGMSIALVGCVMLLFVVIGAASMGDFMEE